MLDEYKLSDEFLDKAVHDFAKTDFAKDYNTFWRFLHSVARAEDKKQITPEQVDKILNWVAETGDNNDKEFGNLITGLNMRLNGIVCCQFLLIIKVRHLYVPIQLFVMCYLTI